MINFAVLIILLFQLFILINGNIWDNVFGNFDAPKVHFPQEFETKLGFAENGVLSYSLKLYVSSRLKAIKMIPYMDTNVGDLVDMNDYKVGTLIFNASDQKVIVNTDQSSCLLIKTPKISKQWDISLADINNMDLNGIWRFIAFYNGKQTLNDTKLYHVFDISTLFSLISSSESDAKALAFFDEEIIQLQQIKFSVNRVKLTLYVNEPLKERTFASDFFKVDEKWECEKRNQTIDYSNQSYEEFFQEAHKYYVQNYKSTVDQLNQFNNLVNGDNNTDDDDDDDDDN